MHFYIFSLWILLLFLSHFDTGVGFKFGVCLPKTNIYLAYTRLETIIFCHLKLHKKLPTDSKTKTLKKNTNKKKEKQPQKASKCSARTWATLARMPSILCNVKKWKKIQRILLTVNLLAKDSIKCAFNGCLSAYYNAPNSICGYRFHIFHKLFAVIYFFDSLSLLKGQLTKSYEKKPVNDRGKHRAKIKKERAKSTRRTNKNIAFNNV